MGLFESFRRFDLSLFRLGSKFFNSQKVVVEVESRLVIGIEDSSDLSTLQGISRPVRFDLIDHPVELDLKVFGEDPGMMVGKDTIEVDGRNQGGMGIL